jgi:hypothetical protein
MISVLIRDSISLNDHWFYESRGVVCRE